jgi:predicted Ser/Thr protein kinase
LKLEKSHFKNIPKLELLMASLVRNKFIDDASGVRIELFNYSSYNPVFMISLPTNTKEPSRVVMRGEAEIAGALSMDKFLALQSEVEVMKILKDGGINVPNLLREGEIFHVLHGVPPDVREFNYFLMSFVPGIAIDNAMRIANEKEQSYLVNKIATIYVRVHKIKGECWGKISNHGIVKTHGENLSSWMARSESTLAILLERCGVEPDFAMRDKLKCYFQCCSKVVKELEERYPHLNEPTMVVFDGSAGNMLVDEAEIYLIDFDRSMYACNLFDFCATLYCLEWYFFDGSYFDVRWNDYLVAYRQLGGSLPQSDDFDRLFPYIMLDYLVLSAIDGIDHILTKKQESARNLCSEIIDLMTEDSITTESIVKSIRKLKTLQGSLNG